jgi:predicted nucleic acid-binding protein
MNPSFLLDTNAISEPLKRQPNNGYMNWLKSVESSQLYISALTLGEIQKDIYLADNLGLQKKLQKYFLGMHDAFEGRVVDLLIEDCLVWGQLVASAQQADKIMPVIDSLLAAQSQRRQMTLVTRNLKDFEQFSNLEVLCPWI